MTEDVSKMDDLDFEPENPNDPNSKEDEDAEMYPNYEESTESAETVSRLKCNQCEFLKFKNIDQWKNHVVGHWRLSGMKNDFEVECFTALCSFSPKDDNFEDRLSKMGEHFIQVHSFKQDAFRKCDICNMEFMEERKYNSHMRKHDESFKCDLCKKKLLEEHGGKSILKHVLAMKDPSGLASLLKFDQERIKRF